jgi:hypothetical protein
MIGDVTTEGRGGAMSSRGGPATRWVITNDGRRRALPDLWVSGKPNGPPFFYDDPTWAPDGSQIAATVQVDYELWRTFCSMEVPEPVSRFWLPCLYDVASSTVTILGSQQVAGVLGFSRDGERLYCGFVGNNEGALNLPRAVPGWLSLDQRPLRHVLRLPGYRASDGTKVLAAGEDPDVWMTALASPDGYFAEGACFTWSRDGRLIAFSEERIVGNEGVRWDVPSKRLAVWELSDPPKRRNALTLDREKRPKLCKLLEAASYAAFSEDNRSLFVTFTTGVTIRWDF